MGNSKSTACMPMCGDKDTEAVVHTKRYSKFKKPLHAKKGLKNILEEEAYERFLDIKVRDLSP